MGISEVFNQHEMKHNNWSGSDEHKCNIYIWVYQYKDSSVQHIFAISLIEQHTLRSSSFYHFIFYMRIIFIQLLLYSKISHTSTFLTFCFYEHYLNLFPNFWVSSIFMDTFCGVGKMDYKKLCLWFICWLVHVVLSVCVCILL